MKGNGTEHPAGISLAKTVLVTGGAGFLGRALIQKLLAEDLTTKVIIIDNGCTGDVPGLIKSTERRIVDPLAKDPVRTILIQSDIRDPKAWHTLVEGLKLSNFPPIREIYHLACPAMRYAFERFPVETLLTSVVGTGQVLIFAEQLAMKLWPELPPPRVVFASSAEVYGEYHGYMREGYEGMEIPESYHGDVTFRGSRACYSAGKRAAETLVEDFVTRSQHGLDVRTARLFNLYGPGAIYSDDRVVPTFVRAAIRGEAIRIHGDGGQTRSFTYIDDAVEGLMMLMAAAATDSWNPIAPLNLADAHGETTINALAELISVYAGHETRIIEHDTSHNIGPRYLVPDLTLTRAALPDWRPKTSLHDGLHKTIADLKQAPTKSGEESALEALRKQNEEKARQERH